MYQNPRSLELITALEKRILVLDGAMGTAIQNQNLTLADFGCEAFEGCHEYLTLTRPDIIRKIHEDYLHSGCDIIETNTFGATPVVLDEYGLGSRAFELNLRAAQLAREAAAQWNTPNKPRFVAGSMGPTTKALSVTGGITFESLQENFYVQAKGLLEGGVDYFLLETCQDTRNVKAALLGIHQLFTELDLEIPIAVSVTIEPMGTMLAGQSIEALLASLSHLKLLYLGLNCATGPELMTEAIRSLARLSKFRVACVPNAGLPDENGCYLETPEIMTNVLSRFVSNGWINLLGGCCGTHSGHIQSLSGLASRGTPRVPAPPIRSFLSGIDFLEITDGARPILVEESINVIGSKQFKTLISENHFEEASDIARTQIKKGAQIIDVCLDNPDRDELEDMRRFMEIAVKKIRTPFMIDSSTPKVIELALTYSQGKSIINSINLADGEDRFKQITPLARKYGAALVVGTLDEDPHHGMALTRQRKLEIAERSFSLLTEKYGIPAEDIYWDPLVFPCATGDPQYAGSAIETIEAIRLIKNRFPQTKTILGISNVSFGLPASGRGILNSVFLYHCVQAGLDLAIVRPDQLIPYYSISEIEKRLSENLLYNRESESSSESSKGTIAVFTTHFRQSRETLKTNSTPLSLSLMDRLCRSILEGSKDGLIADINEALKKMRPLEIINGPLMKGMDEVGRLFSANQLILAEVLQSAEAMKAAVSHLEPFMEKSEFLPRGKIILATVKGDVHDIGKNLVEIILTNNGFNVVDLGIKVAPEQLIQAVQFHQPDIVGLSGLLVKSAQQMVITAEKFSRAGISTPVLVGGAALSSNFVDKHIARAYTTGTVAYAQNAMSGLDLAKTIVDPIRFEKLKTELSLRRNQTPADLPRITHPQGVKSDRKFDRRSTRIPLRQPRLDEIPQPPDFERHLLKNTPIEQIWNFINPLMLYGRHLGIKGSSVRLLERCSQEGAALHEIKQKDSKALNIWRTVQEVKEEYRGTIAMQPSAVYQFFKAASQGNQLYLFDRLKTAPLKNRLPLCTFEFPRQRRPEGLCLSDYSLPIENVPQTSESEIQDNIAMFVVTVGKEVRGLAEDLKKQGQYLKSHIIQALALESAEAYAEMIHSQIRKSWGFPDTPEMTMMDRFQAKYAGKRYSFGYPACPKLDDQAILWDLLHPHDIGIQLTDGMMMDPEASVSAIVFHHPGATYFSVGHFLQEEVPEGVHDDNR